MVYKLIYFPVRGRGQAIRYTFVDNDIPYEEEIVGSNWEELKPTTPFGQVPVVKDGDFMIAQSCAILRYLARKIGTYPSDPVEASKVDMINDHVEDIRNQYVKLIYQNYEDGKQEYVNSISSKLQPIENLLKKWGNDFISSQITFADYNLFDLLDIHQVLAPGCIDGFPTLKGYYTRISERSGIKKLRESEAFEKLPINGNGKQ